MKRLRLPDLLKGLAILFMIQVHIMELFIDTPGRASLPGKISLFVGGPFTAIIFMLVMGYFVAKSKKSITETAWRGVRIFFLGLLLNLGLNFHLLIKIFFADWPYQPLEYVFGVDILLLAGLSILFLALLKSMPKIQLYITWLAFLVVIFFSDAVNSALTFTDRNYATPFVGGYYSWSYFPLFPWLAYPLAGYLFFFAEEKIVAILRKTKVGTIAGIVALTAVVFYFGNFGFSRTIHLSQYYHHGFEYSLWALAVLMVYSIVLWTITLKFKQNKAENFIAWMGKNITLIYVVQWLIIGNLATSIYQTQALKTFPFWFAAVLSITLILTWGLRKINHYALKIHRFKKANEIRTKIPPRLKEHEEF